MIVILQSVYYNTEINVRSVDNFLKAKILFEL